MRGFQEDRSKIQSYIRMYVYLSQIMTFQDIELEKSFVFLKYEQKLPKRPTNRFDISDTIDLDSLQFKSDDQSLDPEDGSDPPN